MKRIILASVTALALAAPAYAQTTTITIEPEQRTKIKQYVMEKKMKPVTVQEEIRVGATLPSSVELHAVPADWGPGLTRYRYVYSGDDIVLVEPSSRKVIQVIE